MIETERLLIRKFSPADVDAVFEMRSDEGTMRFIGKIHSVKEESEKWMTLISAPLDPEGLGYLAVVEKDSGETIGWCGLWRLAETGEVEVGYAISGEKRERGFATEAARAVVGHAFEKLELERVVAVAFPENAASINVMKKLGMSYVRSGVFYGKELVQYSVAATEWRESEGSDVHD